MKRCVGFLATVVVSALLCGPVLAQSCDTVARQELPRLGAATVVTPPAIQTLRIGERFEMRWRRGAVTDRFPAFLLISFDKPVRLSGDGFYALLPGTKNPLKISAFEGATRAVIPYFGPGAPKEGVLMARPLLAGPITVEWAVVGHDHCRELISDGGAGAATIDVTAEGEAEIVIDDALSGETPVERIFSPRGDQVIEVLEGGWRLRDVASGALIADRAGRTPRFSPNGRFVGAFSRNGVEIVDGVSGEVALTVDETETGGSRSADAISWIHGDSFAVVSIVRWGRISVFDLGREGAGLPGDAPEGCRLCSGKEVKLRIDLENNVIISATPHDFSAALLTTRETARDSASKVGSASEVQAFIREKTQVTRGRLELPHDYRAMILTNFKGTNEGQNVAIHKRLAPYLTGESAPTAKALAAASARSRGVEVVDAEAKPRVMLRRLAEFGVLSRERLAGAAQSNGRLARQTGPRYARSDKIVAQLRSEAPRAARKLLKLSDDLPPVEDETDNIFINDFREFCESINTTLDYGFLRENFSALYRFQRSREPFWVASTTCRMTGSAVFGGQLIITAFLRGEESFTLIPSSVAREDCFLDIDPFPVDLALHHERYLSIMSKNKRSIAVFDVERRKLVFGIACAPRGDAIKDVIVAPEKDLVLQINGDGGFVGYRLSGGAPVVEQEDGYVSLKQADIRPLFEGRYVDDEIVVWTEDGRFDATAEGAHYVSLRLPGRPALYTFAQFDAQLRTPGLIGRLFAGERFEPITLTAPPALTGALSAKRGRLSGSAQAAGSAPLEALLVYQDGLVTDRLPAPPEAGSSADWTVDVALAPGTRTATLVVVDQKGLASLPFTTTLPKDAAGARRLHLVAVGVDQYDDPEIRNLEFARIDAENIRQSLASREIGATLASQRLFADAAATPKRILAEIRAAMEKTREGDTLVLFFAGHGLRDEKGAFYFAASATRLADLTGTALPWADVTALLAEFKSRLVVLLDTCHSGAAGDPLFATNDDASASLLERIPSGVVVLSASKGREFAEESLDVAGGGVFTRAVVDVLAGSRAKHDANRDGAIALSELYLGVKRRVLELTEGRQTPWIARNQMVGDFALF